MTRTGKTALWIAIGIGGGLLLAAVSLLIFMKLTSGVLDGARVAATKSQMGSLDVAIHAYADQFGMLPPSSAAQVAACADGRVGPSYSASGAENLYFFLSGWYVSGSDVVQGREYRVADLGGLTRNIKPFYLAPGDEIASAADPECGFVGADKGVFFRDKLRHGRPILYFKARAGVTGNPFIESDNALPINKWKAPNPLPFDSFVRGRDVLRSGDFLLWSAGPDGLFLSDDDIVW